MSILLDPPPLTRRTTPGRAAAWFTLYVVAVIAGGALLGWAVISNVLKIRVSEFSSFLPEVIDRFIRFILSLIQEEPARALRRIQTALAILLAPWLLKKIGWRGFNDLGWSSEQSRPERRRDFIIWFLVGACAMCLLFVVSLFLGVRRAEPMAVGAWIGALLGGLLFRGLAVGFIEETLTRGVLYRSLARAWTPWIAAVVSSGLFAWAHFMKAEPESFHRGAWAVVGSSLFADFDDPATPVKFVNMFVFGIVLCRLVRHRGDIWGAVGLHAAAVGCYKVFSNRTEFNPEVPYQAWLGGHSSKFDDGWLQTALLLAMLAGLEAYHASRRDKPRVRV